MWQHHGVVAPPPDPSRPGPSRPVVLLVHGAWHGAWCFAALQSELERRGIPSLAIDLPGHGSSVVPLGGLDDDAAHVGAVVDRLVAQRPARPVVVVAHSYGGAVVAAALAGRNDVAAVVLLAAYAPVAGESVLDIARAHPDDGSLVAAMTMHPDGTSTLDPERAADLLYGRCDPATAAASVARLDAQQMASMRTPLRASMVGQLPTTYVRCTHDRTVPIDQQDVVAARCDEVVTLETDHSPFLSAPRDVADVIGVMVTRVESAAAAVGSS